MQLLHGDVLLMLKTLPDKSFDCIVTSPPYNIGKNYGNLVNDKKPMNEYLIWIKDIFHECKRVLKDDGSLFINLGYSNQYPWIAMDVAQKLREDYVLQNQIIWVKNISIKNDSYGHFKPINSNRYLNNTNEMIYHFTKTGDVPVERLAIGVPYVYKCNLKSRKDKEKVKPDLRCRGNTWFIPYETIQNNKTERGGHPASYPVELAETCIKLCLGDKKGNVLDPFIGTGTTLVAAKKLGLEGVGIDINQNFLKFSEERLKDTSSYVEENQE
jgi:site-specific DNA-methyltransferase (adenine-specific)